SIGLFVSTFGSSERGVMLKTLFLLLLFGFGLPILWKGATRVADVRLFDFLLLFPSPVYAFKMSASGILTTVRSDFWPSMLTIFAVWSNHVVYRNLGPLIAFAMYGTLALHLLLKFLVTAEACRRFNEDKRSGALELILCTPLKVQSLIRGQSTKIFQVFTFPVLAVGILNLILGPIFGAHEDRGILY